MTHHAPGLSRRQAVQVLSYSFSSCVCQTGLAHMGGAFPYGFANKHKQVIYIYSHTANAQDLVAIPGDLGSTESEHPKHKVTFWCERSANCTAMDERRTHFSPFRIQRLLSFRK